MNKKLEAVLCLIAGLSVALVLTAFLANLLPSNQEIEQAVRTVLRIRG